MGGSLGRREGRERRGDSLGRREGGERERGGVA